MNAPHETDYFTTSEIGRLRRKSRSLLGVLVLLIAIAVTGLVATGGGDQATDELTALPGMQAAQDTGNPGTTGSKTAGGPAVGAKKASGPTAKNSEAEPSTTTSGVAILGTSGTSGIKPTAESPTTESPTTASPPTTRRPGTSQTPTTGGTNPPATSPPTTATPPQTTAAPTPPASPSGWAPNGPAFYVSPGGDDRGDGSINNPWQSLASSVNRLRAGDSLLLMSGTYGNTTSGPTIEINGRNGSSGAPITVAAAPGQSPHILGGGWEAILITNSTYIEIRNLEISGSAAAAQEHSTGIEVTNSHHVTVAGNYVHDMSGGGINGVRSNHLTIENNTIRRTANWSGYQMSAISLFESSNIGGGNDSSGFSFYIRNNSASESRNLVGPISDGNCIIIDQGQATGYSGATSISNNLCVNNGGRGVHVFHSDNVTAYNNTLVGNLQSAEQSGEGELSALYASNVTFRNNLVIPSRDGRGTHTYSASNITFGNNLYVGAAPSQSGPGDLVVGDAQLGGDRIPLQTSPAINAGTASGAPAVDIRGRLRGPAPDIGAYER